MLEDLDNNNVPELIVQGMMDNNTVFFILDHELRTSIVPGEILYNVPGKNLFYTANGYDDFSKNALELIGRNKSRNLRIMQKLRELNQQGKPTIVFACSVKHAQLLSAMLTLENVPNAVVIGDMASYERNLAIKRFKDREDDVNILINYEVLTTGFDATNIECVFIARPTQSVVLYSQMLGRGLRGPQMGGNATCLLVDVKDNLKQYNENMAFSHFNNYWNL